MATDEIGRAFAAALAEFEFDRALAEAQLDDRIARTARWLDEREAYERDRLAAWERQEPERRAGQLAYERAMHQRQAALGAAEPPRIAACLDWTRPQRIRIW